MSIFIKEQKTGCRITRHPLGKEFSMKKEIATKRNALLAMTSTF